MLSSPFLVGEFDAGVDGSDLVNLMINQAFYYLDLLEWLLIHLNSGPIKQNGPKSDQL